MAEQTEKEPQMLIPVTRAEYEQFMQDDTFLPCDAESNPMEGPGDCNQCPKGKVCILFGYDDPERKLHVEWYACAPPEEAEKLSARAIPVTEARSGKQPKYIVYGE